MVGGGEIQTPIESQKVPRTVDRLWRIPNGHLIAKQLLAVVIELQLHTVALNSNNSNNLLEKQNAVTIRFGK